MDHTTTGSPSSVMYGSPAGGGALDSPTGDFYVS